MLPAMTNWISPVWRRASVRCEASIGRLSVGILLTFIGAVLGEWVQGWDTRTVVVQGVTLSGTPSLGRVVIGSAIGAVVLWPVLFVLVWLWQLWVYRHSHHQDLDWTLEAFVHVTTVRFRATLADTAPRVGIHELFEIEVRRDGDIVNVTPSARLVPDQSPTGTLSVTGHVFPAWVGVYDVKVRRFKNGHPGS